MKASNVLVDINENEFKLPYRGGTIYVDLYNYGATVTDGTVNGTRAVTVYGDTTGTRGTLINSRLGRYEFENVPKGKYNVIVSGFGVRTQVLDNIVEVLPYDITGSDLPYKDGATESVAYMIDTMLEWLAELEASSEPTTK